MCNLCLQYILHWWISNKPAIASPLTGIKQNGTLQRNAISKQQLYASLAMNVTGTQSQQCCLFCNPPQGINAWLHLAWPLSSATTFISSAMKSWFSVFISSQSFLCPWILSINNSLFTAFVYLLRATLAVFYIGFSPSEENLHPFIAETASLHLVWDHSTALRCEWRQAKFTVLPSALIWETCNDHDSSSSPHISSVKRLTGSSKLRDPDPVGWLQGEPSRSFLSLKMLLEGIW